MARAQSSSDTILIVDSLNSRRDGLAATLRGVGYSVSALATADALLSELKKPCSVTIRRCIVSDVELDGMSGFEMLEELSRIDSAPPLVFLTGSGDVPQAVHAIKLGAFDFLERPIATAELLERFEPALQLDRAQRRQSAKLARIRAGIELLSMREREILRMIVQGRTSKEIAVAFNISTRTVENHRLHILRKMHANNSIELVRQVMTLNAGHVAGQEAQDPVIFKSRGPRYRSGQIGPREPAESILSGLLS